MREWFINVNDDTYRIGIKGKKLWINDDLYMLYKLKRNRLGPLFTEYYLPIDGAEVFIFKSFVSRELIVDKVNVNTRKSYGYEGPMPKWMWIFAGINLLSMILYMCWTVYMYIFMYSHYSYDISYFVSTMAGLFIIFVLMTYAGLYFALNKGLSRKKKILINSALSACYGSYVIFFVSVGLFTYGLYAS